MASSNQSPPDAGEEVEDWDSVRPSKRLAPRGAAAYPRQRAVTACQVCRARRTKCDNQKPKCSFCAKTGAECISTPSDLSSFDPASLKILERLDEIEKLVRREGLSEPARRSSVPSPYTSDLIPSSKLPETIESILKWPIFRGRIAERPCLTSLLSSTCPLPSASSPASTTPYVPVEDFDHKTCTRLLDNFLGNVHVKNPLLEEAYARQLIKRICLDGISNDVHSCLMLLICALGSVAVPFGDPTLEGQDRTNFPQGQAYFNAAQKRIGPLLGSCGVYEAQCFFWSGVYLMCAMQPLLAWRMFVQGLSCCQAFEFATRSSVDGAERQSSNTADPTMEERVYWSCWKSERELRGEIQPPDFKNDALDYPRSFPTPPLNSQGMEHVSWCFYLAEISLLRLRLAAQNDILSTDSSSGSSFFTELAGTVGVHESRIDAWTQSLPVVITLGDLQASDDVLRFILRGHRLNFYEILYGAFVHCVILDGSCSPAIMDYAAKGLQVHVDRLTINRPGFKHRHHGTWGMLRSCTRSALIIFAAAYNDLTRRILPHGWQDAVIAAIGMLESWRYEVGDADDRASVLRDLWIGLTHYR